jgi:hypothetical protein
MLTAPAASETLAKIIMSLIKKSSGSNPFLFHASFTLLAGQSLPSYFNWQPLNQAGQKV